MWSRGSGAKGCDTIPKTHQKTKASEDLASSSKALEKKPKLYPLAMDLGVHITPNPPTVTIRKSPTSFVMNVKLTWFNSEVLKEIYIPVLIDTGAEVSVFDISFMKKYGLPWERRSKPIRILNADNSVAQRGGRCKIREIIKHATDCRTVLGTVLAKGIHDVEMVEAVSGQGMGRDITIIVKREVPRKARSFREEVIVFNLSV